MDTNTIEHAISLNCQYMILFKNPKDGRQIEYLANQIYPQQFKKGMIESFHDATNMDIY
jgi:hypothetical protein